MKKLILTIILSFSFVSTTSAQDKSVVLQVIDSAGVKGKAVGFHFSTKGYSRGQIGSLRDRLSESADPVQVTQREYDELMAKAKATRADIAAGVFANPGEREKAKHTDPLAAAVFDKTGQ
ncbi:MAG: hypothetical protein V4736_02150 [Bdellovibrionota bacterium]